MFVKWSYSSVITQESGSRCNMKKDEKLHISNLQCILNMDNMPENKKKTNLKLIYALVSFHMFLVDWHSCPVFLSGLCLLSLNFQFTLHWPIAWAKDNYSLLKGAEREDSNLNLDALCVCATLQSMMKTERYLLYK